SRFRIVHTYHLIAQHRPRVVHTHHLIAQHVPQFVHTLTISRNTYLNSRIPLPYRAALPQFAHTPSPTCATPPSIRAPTLTYLLTPTPNSRTLPASSRTLTPNSRTHPNLLSSFHPPSTFLNFFLACRDQLLTASTVTPSCSAISLSGMSRMIA